MKANERHHLKQNEFAETTAQILDVVSANRNQMAMGAGVLILLVAVISGYFYVRTQRANDAGALLGVAMATAQGAVVPAPSLPGTTQQAGTFPTEEARADAAIKAYNAVVEKYPNTDAGIAAAYHVAAEELARGRAEAAAQGFATVISRAGNSVYAPLAKLGQAEALLAGGKTDEAIALYTELAATRDGALPVDAVLMELGRASLKAGKQADARAAFKRVVDEFPNSAFTADAQQRLAALN